MTLAKGSSPDLAPQSRIYIEARLPNRHLRAVDGLRRLPWPWQRQPSTELRCWHEVCGVHRCSVAASFRSCGEGRLALRPRSLALNDFKMTNPESCSNLTGLDSVWWLFKRKLAAAGVREALLGLLGLNRFIRFFLLNLSSHLVLHTLHQFILNCNWNLVCSVAMLESHFKSSINLKRPTRSILFASLQDLASCCLLLEALKLINLSLKFSLSSSLLLFVIGATSMSNVLTMPLQQGLSLMGSH